MNESQALGKLIRTFPKSRVLPQLKVNPAGLAECPVCHNSTVWIDAQGMPFHEKCKAQSLGIPT